jgi:exopolyphosphatase/guanosine-5'-triphosphate,3'-diphosphate pyrophosphatase
MASPVEDTETAVPVTVQGLCARYAVDMDHARQVASHALALFDSLADVHGLPQPRRALLETAALLHDLGASVDPDRHHTAGRDLLLRESIEGCPPAERDALACLVRFHRKKVRPGEEPAFAALPADLQTDTLALAALLRIGDALDASRSQTCRILSAGTGKGEAHLIVEGLHADIDAERAVEKSDLWNDLFPWPLRVWNAGGAGLSEAPAGAREANAAPESPSPDQN